MKCLKHLVRNDAQVCEVIDGQVSSIDLLLEKGFRCEFWRPFFDLCRYRLDVGVSTLLQ